MADRTQIREHIAELLEEFREYGYWDDISTEDAEEFMEAVSEEVDKAKELLYAQFVYNTEEE